MPQILPTCCISFPPSELSLPSRLPCSKFILLTHATAAAQRKPLNEWMGSASNAEGGEAQNDSPTLRHERTRMLENHSHRHF